MLPARRLAAEVVFGLSGNAAPYLTEGWSFPEPHHTWGTGAQSVLRVTVGPGAGSLMLEMAVVPMVAPPIFRAQALTVRVNGRDVGSARLEGEGTLGFAIPDDVGRGDGALTITLLHPDAVVPAELGLNEDTRSLSVALRRLRVFWAAAEPPYAPRARPALPMVDAGALAEAVRGLTALPVGDLVTRFESLGTNCEFGLLQHKVGVEPLGLLRYGGISPVNLLRGLESGFEGIEEPGRLRVYTESNVGREEYLVRDDRYRVQFHTGIFETAASPEEVRARMVAHLTFLRRNFLEKLQSGQYLFVIHDRGCRAPAQVLPILHALRAHGPNALLFVTEEREAAPGGVTQLARDLFHGVTDLLPPMHMPERIRVPVWLSLCANAYRMWRESGLGA
jgi:hypothetical protein